MKSLRQVCELTGVNRQFMQRLAYKNDGTPYLLPPTELKGNGGYWYYDDEAIQRLWMILMFRELDGKMKDIEKIMDSPDFDRKGWLGNQIDLLKKKQERIKKMIYAAEMIRTTGILPGDLDGNKDYTVSGFLTQVSESMQKTSPDHQKKVSKVLGDKTFNAEVNRIIDFMEAGEEANTVKVHRAVGRMWRAFRDIMGRGSSLGFSNLGLMMRSDGLFADKFDEARGKGTAKFVGEAIGTYCQRHKNMEVQDGN